MPLFYIISILDIGKRRASNVLQSVNKSAEFGRELVVGSVALYKRKKS